MGSAGESSGEGGQWKVTLSSVVVFGFFCFLVVVEVVQKLQFLNEYRELETVEPGDRAEEFRETFEKALDTGR